MNDSEFLRHLENGQLHELPHRAHLRLAWLYLRADGFDQGGANVRAMLRQIVASHGAADKYHETITAFWIYLVYYAMTLTPEIDTFDAFIAAHDHLLDGSLLKRHYSAERLRDSRTVYAPPDLRPLPDITPLDQPAV